MIASRKSKSKLKKNSADGTNSPSRGKRRRIPKNAEVIDLASEDEKSTSTMEREWDSNDDAADSEYDENIIHLMSDSEGNPVSSKLPSVLVGRTNNLLYEHVGDKETGMVLVHPVKEHPALRYLDQIHQSLKKQQTRFEINMCIYNHSKNPDLPESCRVIQGGRMEIFLDAKDKSSAAFDNVIAKHLEPGAKEVILDYCREQANKDPRLRTQRYRYENFSLIVSFQQQKAQVPHLDLVHPNFQFGMVVSPDANGTLFVENRAKFEPIDTIEKLEDLWTTDPEFADEMYTEMPQNIKIAFNNNDGAKQLLRYFGDTLFPERKLEASCISRNGLATGTLASLPGSVVHAGPSSNGARAILFFSGTPEDTSLVDPYLPDSQYNGVTLLGHLISILWRRDLIEFKERHYLLRRLAQYVKSSRGTQVWTQFGEGALRDAVKEIKTKRSQESINKITQEKAHCLNMIFAEDPFSVPDVEINPNDLELVSCEGLFTKWEGSDLNALVYRHKRSNKIIIRYMYDGPDASCPDEYEGHKDEDRLKLIMNPGEDGSKFDGSNGRLLDSEGVEINLYKPRKRRTKRLR